MAHAAAEALAQPAHCGVILTAPKGAMPKTFPRGELLNERKRNGVIERTYNFDPGKVIAWLIKNELVIMERTSDNVLTFSEPTAGRLGGEGSET
jgi:hypothetical protein